MDALLNRLKWRHLRLIHAIGEVGQLSIAAERLAMTQPAASRMMADIEALIGMELFFRTPKGMSPTPVGEVFIHHAEGLLRGLSSMANEVNAFSAGKSGSVRVGAVTGAAVAYVVPAIRALKEDAQSADLHIDVGPSAALINGLLDGEFDFVLCRVPPEMDPRLLEIMRGRVELVEFIVRPGHPLLSLDIADLEDLAGYSWVTQAPGSPMRQAVEEAFIARNVPVPGEIVNTTSLLVMIAYLQSSDAISPISSEVAELLDQSTGDSIKTVRLRQSIIIAPYHLIQRKDQIVSPMALRLRDLVIEALSTVRPEEPSGRTVENRPVSAESDSWGSILRSTNQAVSKK